MISITEKTADSICKEFRGMLKAIDERVAEEKKDYKEVADSYEKLNRNNPLFSMAEKMFNDVNDNHKKMLELLDEEKKKYTKFIEILMIGETA